MQLLVDRTLAHGGQVSYKTNTDGSKSVYELNVTLFDALNHAFTTLPTGGTPFTAADGGLVATGGADRRVLIWDAATREQAAVWCVVTHGR